MASCTLTGPRYLPSEFAGQPSSFRSGLTHRFFIRRGGLNIFPEIKEFKGPLVPFRDRSRVSSSSWPRPHGQPGGAGSDSRRIIFHSMGGGGQKSGICGCGTARPRRKSAKFGKLFFMKPTHVCGVKVYFQTETDAGQLVTRRRSRSGPCQVQGEVDLRTFDRHPETPITDPVALVPALHPNPPFAHLDGLRPAN